MEGKIAASVTSGASFTGITVNVNVSSSDKNPSLTVTVTSAEPFQFNSGVITKMLSVVFTVRLNSDVTAL